MGSAAGSWETQFGEGLSENNCVRWEEKKNMCEQQRVLNMQINAGIIFCFCTMSWGAGRVQHLELRGGN